MKEFWALVNNGLRYRRQRFRKSRSSVWWKVYLIAALLFTLGSLAYSIYRGEFPPYALLNSLVALTFIAFAFSLSSIKREWRDQTVSWWLTLPYPRSELLLAKLVASFLRLLRISVWFIAFLAVVVFMGRLLNPSQWTMVVLGNFIQSWVLLFIVTLLVSPLAMNLGMLMALTLRTRKPWTPLLWGLTASVLGISFGYINQLGFSKSGPAQTFIDPLPYVSLSTMAATVLVMLLVAAIIFGISCYVLAEQTEI